jgi:hypothetical protein
MTDSLNEKTLTDRWKEHCAGPKDSLRAKLIDAVSAHEGWEESAVSIVDTAVIPVIRRHEAAPQETTCPSGHKFKLNLTGGTWCPECYPQAEQPQDVVRRVARAIIESHIEQPIDWDKASRHPSIGKYERIAKAAIAAMRDQHVLTDKEIASCTVLQAHAANLHGGIDQHDAERSDYKLPRNHSIRITREGKEIACPYESGQPQDVVRRVAIALTCWRNAKR